MLLRPLIGQFPSQDGDAEGKLLGYVIALEGEPRWSIEKAIRRFIRGDVREHDGRFLPTSAELARVVRAETAHVLKMADYEAKFGGKKPVYRSRKIVYTDWHKSFPTLDQFQSWNLPEGSIIQAHDATVIFPNGAVRSWTECERSAQPKNGETAGLS